jgi:hypothetical protein
VVLGFSAASTSTAGAAALAPAPRKPISPSVWLLSFSLYVFGLYFYVGNNAENERGKKLRKRGI